MIPRLLASLLTLFALVSLASATPSFRSAASASYGPSIGFRAASSAATNGSSLGIERPAGTAANDVMIASISTRPSSATIGAPAGWTLVRRIDNGTNISLAVFRKVAGAGEPASYTWDVSGATFAVGGIQAFINVDAANPIDVENGQATPTTLTHATPSVTTTVANAMVVTAHTFATSTTWTPPTGMTEAFDVQFQPVEPNFGHSMEGNYVAQSTAGATGTKTATAAGGSGAEGAGATHVLALRPGAPMLGIERPAGTATNDVMIASIGVRPSSATIAAPTGWTLVRRVDNGTNISLAVFRKVAGASEPPSYTWNVSGVTYAVGGIQSFSNVDTANPIDVENGQATPTTLTHATPSVTTTVPNTMLVTAHTLATSTTWTQPAGMTEAFDVQFQPVAPNFGQSMEGNYVAQGTAGATGTKTATASGGSGAEGLGATHILALRSGGMTPPQAVLNATPATGPAPLTVTFNSNSTPGSAPFSSVTLDFGDGSPVLDWTPDHPASKTHPYAAGNYTATLTVTTAHGSSSAPQPISAGAEFPSAEPPAPNGEAVPTFHSMGLYMDLASAPQNRVLVRYRRATDDPANPASWKDGYPLWYDARSTNPGCTSACGLPYTSSVGVQRARGSVVNLEPGTKYVFELRRTDSPDWEWHLIGTTWAQTAESAWPETLVQDGLTTPIPSQSDPYVITQGGSAEDGYKVYDGWNGSSKNVVDRGGQGLSSNIGVDASHAIVVRASYVIVRRVIARGAATAAIYIAPNMKNVVIEDSLIEDWAHRPGVDTNSNDGALNPNPNSWSDPNPGDGVPEYWGWNHAAGVYLGGDNSRITIQRNIIREPHWGSFPWDTQVDGFNIQCDRPADQNPGNHPHGPVGIHVSSGGRQNVIRYNEITGHETNKRKWYLDGIGGGENFSGQGSPGADSDIYQNIIMHVFDDAIEAEGGGRNVRVWGNYISNTKSAIATSIVHFGPLYIWRNVVNRVRICHQQTNQDGDWFSEAFKTAGRKGTNDMWGDGIRYYFHNTLLQDPGSGGLPEGAGKGLTGENDGTRSARWTFARNNIFHVRADCLLSSSPSCLYRWAWSLDPKASPPAGWDFASNLFNGRYEPTAERDANMALGFSFSGTEVGYSDGHGPSSVPQLGGGGEGKYQLATGKKGRDTWIGNGQDRECELLANFSDNYFGSAPDCGAHEGGSPPMKFGISAGQ